MQMGGGGQGQDRTADLPLFSIKEHRLRRCNRVYPRCSRTAMGRHRLSCTRVDETKTETRARRASWRRHGVLLPGSKVLAATVFAHESAAFGVQVLAELGGDLRLGGRPGCRAGVGSGCAKEAGERGDGFEQQGVEAGLLVGGAAALQFSVGYWYLAIIRSAPPRT